MSYEIKSILYTSDLTSGSPPVFRHAVGLAERLGAELHAITVTAAVPMHPFAEYVSPEKIEEIKTAASENQAAELRKRLDEFADKNPDYDVKKVLASVTAVEGDAPKSILAAAKNVSADMIIMGSRGHSPMGEIFIGSVAAKVTMKTKIPVILVPMPAGS